MDESSAPRDAGLARVSVVVPARNSASTLEAAVRSALLSELVAEVVVAVGPSEDDTLGVAERLTATDPRVRVVPNPIGTTPAALNRAVAASSGDVVVRLDAHAELPPGYVVTAIEALARTGAGNVGGRQVPVAQKGFGAAVAAAMRSPVGTGGATYRTGTTPGEAETVYLGVFRREALDAVGGFDERLDRNQDYELNHRLRQAGWKVWFEPKLEVVYRPRSTVRGLARQYHDYGRWKRFVLREHPGSVKLRQLAPPLLVAGTAVALTLGAVTTWWLPVAAIGVYLTLLIVAAFVADPRRGLLVAVALATMHWSWGLGFLRGAPRHVGRNRGASEGASAHG